MSKPEMHLDPKPLLKLILHRFFGDASGGLAIQCGIHPANTTKPRRSHGAATTQPRSHHQRLMISKPHDLTTSRPDHITTPPDHLPSLPLTGFVDMLQHHVPSPIESAASKVENIYTG